MFNKFDEEWEDMKKDNEIWCARDSEISENIAKYKKLEEDEIDLEQQNYEYFLYLFTNIYNKEYKEKFDRKFNYMFDFKNFEELKRNSYKNFEDDINKALKKMADNIKKEISFNPTNFKDIYGCEEEEKLSNRPNLKTYMDMKK